MQILSGSALIPRHSFVNTAPQLKIKTQGWQVIHTYMAEEEWPEEFKDGSFLTFYICRIICNISEP